MKVDAHGYLLKIKYFNMKKIILLLVCCWFFTETNAQQETAFSQYHLNRSLINPAATGANNLHTVFSHLRFQWTGLPNSPKTGLMSYQVPLGRIGLGATFVTDRVASLNRFSANIAYAYRVKINDNYNLSFGMAGSYQRFYLSKNALEGVEDQNDLVVHDAMEGLNVYDANLGVYFYNKKMYMGFSVPNVVQARLNTIGTNLSTVSQLSRQYLFTAGYKYLPEKSFFSVEPSILLRKIEGLPFQALLTAKFGVLNDKIFTAFTYGTSDVFTTSLGYQISSEGKIAYSYDYYLGDLYRYTRGSHEISVIWEFGKPNYQKLKAAKRYKG